MEEKKLYKIIYSDATKIHEIYANIVNQSTMLGFVEVSDIVFEKDTRIIDPSEEKLRTEFSNVNTTYIPLQAIIRIDYVTKKGVAKIHDLTSEISSKKASSKSNILTFN